MWASYLLLLSSVTITINIVASENYDFKPKWRHVDVFEGDEYIVGFEEKSNLTNITTCYYKNELFTGQFTVVKYRKKKTYFEEKPSNEQLQWNKFRTWGESGLCWISLDGVNGAGPKEWTIEGYDEFSEKTFTEIVTVDIYKKMQPSWTTLNVMESGSFFQYMVSSGVDLVSCRLKYDATVIDLGPLTYNGTNTKVAPLKRKECGFFLNNASTSDPSDWALLGEDASGQKYRAIFKTVVFPLENHNETVEVLLGERETIRCGLPKFGNQDFCHLFNPNGEKVFQGTWCEYKREMVTIEDFGEWKCVTGREGIMDPIEYFVTIVKKSGIEYVKTWSDDGENSVKIGCKIINARSSIQSCQLVRPDKTVISVHCGGGTKRYLSLGTNFTAATCEMEIEKPLLEEEKGTWTCELLSNPDVIGGFIQIEKPSNEIFPKRLLKTVLLNKPLKIECQVDYSADYCFITAPNATRYISATSSLGKCVLEIKSSSLSDNGTWVCNFARSTGTKDDRIIVEVSIGEVLSYYKSVRTVKGSNSELLCSSNGFPLLYCRFVSPVGIAFNVKENTSSNSISYFGKGLEFGECGIKIENTQFDHQGLWTCFVVIGNNFQTNETSAKIKLLVYGEPLNVAASVGLGVGLSFVAIIFLIFALNKWRKRNATPVLELNDESIEANNTVIFDATYHSPDSHSDGDSNNGN